MGRLLCWCGRKCGTDTSCWLFTDCKSMCYWCSFLYLNFYCIFYDSVVVYISIFWKRDIFFGKHITPAFWLQISPSVFSFFCHTVYHITKTDFFFSLLLVFITSPKRLSALKLPFHIFLRASPSKSKLLLSSPLCCFVLFNSLFIFYSFYLFIRINTELKL